MAEYHSSKEIQNIKDVKEAIEKIKKLDQQLCAPDRDGMISALMEAKNKAPREIFALEQIQGDTKWMPAESFTNNDLYRKLSQYRQGLEAYCIEKVGKQIFDKLNNT